VVPLARGLGARGRALATLALDPSLETFDPSRALFLDTETTGLSVGPGTLVFLVGLGAYEDGCLRVEQLFLEDPSEESGLLHRVREHLADCQTLVTFNGKSYDLPLLRARCVMAGLGPLPERPHLDLLHLSRRVYGDRVERCRLTQLEREVLGFEREEDIAGEDIPARYQAFLQRGDREGLAPVLRHNVQDVAALAALLGELSARASREDTEGRFEPEDRHGLARTALRAGETAFALTLAEELAAAGVRAGALRRDAHALAARVLRARRDHAAAREELLKALALAPEDPKIHLRLSQCFERLPDGLPRALEHALRAAGAESEDVHARRLSRLRKRVEDARRQLRLPGF
jgi:uncharacterized protein YprB with RNaseH-like and TPR domain